MRAGEQALRRGALVEAAQLLQHATELLLRVTVPREQAAHTHRLLAQSLAGLGRTAACAKACQLGLRALGRPLPPPTLGLVAGILGALAGQARRVGRTAGASPAPPAPPAASIAAITRSVSAPLVARNAATAFGTTIPGRRMLP